MYTFLWNNLTQLSSIQYWSLLSKVWLFISILMFTVYLIKVFGVETLTFALALIKCCWVAKCYRNSFTKIFDEKEMYPFQVESEIYLVWKKPFVDLIWNWCCEAKKRRETVFCSLTWQSKHLFLLRDCFLRRFNKNKRK